MSIVYPLAMPTVTGLARISLRALNATLVSRSPFTFKEQVQTFGAQRWEADISLPPMKRAAAETWIAWLMSLKGQRGTFYLGDPTGVSPRGTATISDAPTIFNDGVTYIPANDTIWLKGCPTSQSAFLKAGDYVQLGDSSDGRQHLHKVLQDVPTDTNGYGKAYIWPNIRRAAHKVDSYNLVKFYNAKGIFRLVDNAVSWDINNAQTYGLNFSAIESIETDINGEIA